MSRRRCLIFNAATCADGGWCLPGQSRCRAHDRRAWRGVPPERKVAYMGNWARLRKIVLEREPTCHWRFPGCSGVSTQVDHLLGVSKGGTNDLSNLVGSCASCNRKRAGRDGAAEAARRRRRRDA